MTYKIKGILVLILSILLLGGCGSTAMTYAQKEMARQIDRLCIERNFNGAVLVVNKGQVILSKGYGLANYEEKTPNSPDTVFRIASLSKQFTAAAILLLEERGLLKTDDPLSKYIPDFANGDRIALHHLLTHTSGITDYISLVEKTGDHAYSPTELIAQIKDKPLLFNPGEKFAYSNSNYALLGYIIEQVSGMSYGDFMAENIIKPLGMENTGYAPNETLPGRAVGYDNIRDGSKATPMNLTVAYAAGGLESTVQDLYKWLQALDGTTLLSEKSRNKMFTRHLSNYGYGWMISHFSEDIMWHSGSLNGFLSVIYRDTKQDNAIIILCNNYLTNLGMLRDKINEILKAGE